MDIIHDSHPHFHPHEMELMDHVKRSIASSYTSLLSHIDSHIDDERRHISIDDRDRWDNKADKVSLYDLELRLTNKADRADLIELQEAIAKIKTAVNGEDGSDGLNGSSSITERELKYILKSEGYVKLEDLDAYATKQWCEDTFLKKSDYEQSVIEHIQEYIIEHYGEDNPGSGGSGGSGSGGSGVSPEVQEQIDEINDKIDNLVQYDDEHVRDIIDGILDDWDWISELPEGITKYPMDWNGDLEAFIQYVINKDADGNGATWSSMMQKYNEIKNEVDSLRLDVTETGQISLETLASIISNRIEYNAEGLETSVAELTTMWSKLIGDATLDQNDPDYLKKLRDLLDDYDTYEWVISGFQSYANQEGGLARMYADAMSKITDAEGNITRLDATANVLTEAKTDLENRMASAEASITSKASLDDVAHATAGFVTESYVDGEITSAIATLFAEDGEGTAAISAAVENGISNIEIDADNINLNGQTSFLEAIGNSIQVKSIGVVDQNDNNTFSGAMASQGGITVGTFYNGSVYGTNYVTISEGHVKGGLLSVANSTFDLSDSNLKITSGDAYTTYGREKITFNNGSSATDYFTIDPGNNLIIDGHVKINGMLDVVHGLTPSSLSHDLTSLEARITALEERLDALDA